MMKSVLTGIKAAVQKHHWAHRKYQDLKAQRNRLRTLRYFLYDIRNTYRSMFWPDHGLDYRRLAASLLFQYHKLEKGLVMPGPPRMFGMRPAQAVLEHLQRWHKAGHDLRDPVYLGALETLQAYLQRLTALGLDPRGEVAPQVARFLQEHAIRTPELATPQPLLEPLDTAAAYAAFQALALRRRSVRAFKPDPIPNDVLRRAVQLAQLSPSVCNRQTCQVQAIVDPGLQAAVLAHQNGNSGFGHLAPLVLLITAEESDFFDASERHQPYMDGGLFTMSFILALQAQGVSTCCLNWCVPPDKDLAVHRLTGLPASTRILTMMVAGYSAPDCQVPRSPRRDTTLVLRFLGRVTPSVGNASSEESSFEPR